MEENTVLSRLPGALLPWYRQNRRDLPWRRDREPYHIWISEIMLQQTRVEAVKGYYARFLQELPDFAALAACDDEKLHKLWEGLGYYSRVRNLKKAAGVIISEHGGIFPREYGAVHSLPGIGDYTAGAICSIAYGQPTPAVDGNVLRLCARLTDDPSPIDLPATRRRFHSALAAVYPEAAGEFTQALMELGATVCGPNRAPDCGRCPCRDFCLARQRGTALSLPVKSAKKAKKEEKRTVFILTCGDLVAIRKRPEQGLLAGLWEFPNISGHFDPSEACSVLAEMGVVPVDIRRCTRKKHIFTHIIWDMAGQYWEVAEPAGDLRWVTKEAITTQAALPTAFRLFWEEE